MKTEQKILTVILPYFLLSVLVARVAIAPLVGVEAWGYHLPFASCQWNIGGGCGTFRMSQYTFERLQGFPKLWELAQGAFWFATGMLGSIVLPQLLMCAAYFWTCMRVLHVPGGMLAVVILSCPMIVRHFVDVGNDLPSALAVAIGFFLLTDIMATAATEGGRKLWWKAGGAVVALAIAGNIKYPALLGCLVTAAAIGAVGLVMPGISRARRAALLLTLVVAASAASSWALINYARFSNPFYPFKIAVAGNTAFQGPEDLADSAERPAYLLYASRKVSFPTPINFVLSVTEFDWTMRGVPPWYSGDSEAGELWQRRGDPARTGGWGGVFVLVNMSLLLFQLLRPAQMFDRKQRTMVISAVLLCVLTAFLPRSFHLRYWLYLPLIVAPLNLRFLLHADPQARVVPLVLAGIMLLGLSQLALSPRSQVFARGLEPQAARQAEVPAEVRRALQTDGIYCSQDDLTFAWSSAVTGLPGTLSFNPADCAAR